MFLLGKSQDFWGYVIPPRSQVTFFYTQAWFSSIESNFWRSPLLLNSSLQLCLSGCYPISWSTACKNYSSENWALSCHLITNLKTKCHINRYCILNWKYLPCHLKICYSSTCYILKWVQILPFFSLTTN